MRIVGAHFSGISIHAPARGATLSAPASLGGGKFQFTPLREGRRCVTGCCKFSSRISIHAPARGATPQGNAGAYSLTFQFTPLREGRPAAPSGQPGVGRAVHFNSRPCERGDIATMAERTKTKIFQFTPLREGRPARADGQRDRAISIHAPARGATAKSNKICSVFSAIIEKNS